MQVPSLHQRVIDRLCALAALVGIGPPASDESPARYGSRILNAIDPENEFFDDIRFQVLALINQLE
jgi:hypothetical protein